MSPNIEAIFLDTGNTMRKVSKDPTFQSAARQQLATLLGSTEAPDALCNRLDERYESYKKWAKENRLQATEHDLWQRWMLPDFPDEKLSPLVGRLTRLWIDQGGHRIARPEVRMTIMDLSKRGYSLGIIANTLSKTEIPDWLEEDGLASDFKAIVLSSTFGIRKPDPEVYLEAARQAGVDPSRCAYVGDNPSRDIAGARAAGFKLVVILLEADTLNKEPPRVKERPDTIIYKFGDLLTIFPPL